MFDTVLRIYQLKTVSIFNFNLTFNLKRASKPSRDDTLASHNFVGNSNFALKLHWEKYILVSPFF